MKGYRKKIGDFGEDLAIIFLQKHGYKIIDRNYCCRYGELDIVVQKDGCLVFVEVKTRTSIVYGFPKESITRWKRERIEQTIFKYLQENGMEENDFRVDVIEVLLDKKARQAKIRHWKAVEL